MRPSSIRAVGSDIHLDRVREPLIIREGFVDRKGFGLNHAREIGNNYRLIIRPNAVCVNRTGMVILSILDVARQEYSESILF
jgi:hypothetical protein